MIPEVAKLHPINPDGYASLGVAVAQSVKPVGEKIISGFSLVVFYGVSISHEQKLAYKRWAVKENYDCEQTMRAKPLDTAQPRGCQSQAKAFSCPNAITFPRFCGVCMALAILAAASSAALRGRVLFKVGIALGGASLCVSQNLADKGQACALVFVRCVASPDGGEHSAHSLYTCATVLKMIFKLPSP